MTYTATYCFVEFSFCCNQMQYLISIENIRFVHSPPIFIVSKIFAYRLQRVCNLVGTRRVICFNNEGKLYIILNFCVFGSFFFSVLGIMSLLLIILLCLVGIHLCCCFL
jgi:hypothetical protein